MKTYITTLLVLGFTYACTSQVITDQQYFLVSKVTADWCPKCGEYGWSFYKELEQSQKNSNVLVLAVHKNSSSIATPTSSALADNFNVFSQPHFFLNDAELNVTADNWSAKLKELEGDLKIIATTGAAFLAVNSKVTPNSNGKYDVTLKAKSFFDIAKGDYFAGVYLVDDNLIGYQQSQSATAKHTGVIRQNILNPAKGFGESVFTFPVKAEQEYTYQYNDVSIDIGTRNPTDFRLITILWTRDKDGVYKFSNAAVTPLDKAITSTDEFDSELALTLHYNKANSNLVIDSDKSTSSLRDITKVSIIDINGRVVHTTKSLDGQSTMIQLPTLASGIYFAQLDTAKQPYLVKFFVD